MRQLWKKHFPDHMYTVQKITTTGKAKCLKENGHNLIKLILNISCNDAGNGTELEHMLECSGPVNDDQPQDCTYFGEPNPGQEGSDPNLIGYLTAVLSLTVVVAMVLLVVLAYRKKEVIAFAKQRWAAGCR